MSAEPEIEQLFVRLCALVTRVSTNHDGSTWYLVPGIEEGAGQPRTQWRIDVDGVVVVPLGYTRRQVLASLTSMTSILAVCLGA